MSKQYIFGPVSSRRLGRSLGVDLLRVRRCTLDCIYCEAGATEELTCSRSQGADPEKVKAELAEVLKDSPQLDYITFSGLGEPTLHPDFGGLAHYIKETYPQYKICLLTNGTLLNDPEVRSALQYVDLAMPNFDASSDHELQTINRPAAGITVETLAEGIRLAAAEYPGKLVLELFVVPGVNDSEASIERFVQYVKSFKDLKSVQLNTLDRPGVVDWIKPAPPETLKRFISALEKILPVEAVGRYRHRSGGEAVPAVTDGFALAMIDFLKDRAMSAEEMSLQLNVDAGKVQQIAEDLVKNGCLSAEKCGQKTLYRTIL